MRCHGVLPRLVPFLLLAALARPADAQAPLVAELERVATTYHEDLTRLDAIRAKLEDAVRADPRAEHLVALARASFLWGDVRATTSEQKLEAYDRGREVGRRAVELAPHDPAAHFWLTTNTARWGQVRGVVRSLFLLSSVRDGIRTVLELDPGFTPVYVLAGNVDTEVPGLLGGDLDRAERMFRTGLAQDPHYTASRIGLARVLGKKGRAAEARRELQAVLDETAPRNRADWTVKDVPEARRLLAETGGR